VNVRRYEVTLLLICALFNAPARAADPQAYKVEIASVNDGEIDATLKATSDLQTLRKAAPVSPFGLIARARSDVDRLKTALESFGYYESKVTIAINGIALADPGLGDALTALPQDQDARVEINFALGALYHLRHIVVEGEMPPTVDAHAALGLVSGQAAVASTILAGGAKLANALQERGYAFARVDAPVAYEAAEEPALDLTFQAVLGPKVNIGEIRFEGLQRIHERLLRRRLLMHSGDSYRPSRIEQARRDLLALGVFGQVSVQLGAEPDPAGRVPVTFKMRERLRHAVSVSAAFSTDLGGSGGITWTDRNLFGNAEQLNLKARVLNLGGNDTTGIGYDTSAVLSIPEFKHRDQTLQFALSALRQSLEAYDQTSRTAGVALARKLSSVWTVSAGVSISDEKVLQEQIKYFYTLVQLPFNISYDSTNLASPLDDPTHGFRASLEVKPTLAIGHPDALFLVNQVKFATFFDLKNLFGTVPGRSVIAARALAGSAQGASEFSLPPDQRFYGGGSGTIRGYAYQSVGPRFANDPVTPTGGTAISAAGIEWRQRFGMNFGAAFFVDAGQVSTTFKLVPDDLSIGIGAGIRYYTAIGPIRFDVAVPTKHQSGDDSFQIYIGLGQAF
jgi:translocation and assembly module TamA